VVWLRIRGTFSNRKASQLSRDSLMFQSRIYRSNRKQIMNKLVSHFLTLAWTWLLSTTSNFTEYLPLIFPTCLSSISPTLTISYPSSTQHFKGFHLILRIFYFQYHLHQLSLQNLTHLSSTSAISKFSM